jgi:hypothetical protein
MGMYCIHYDMVTDWRPGWRHLQNASLGELPIVLRDVVTYGDLVEFYLRFKFNDTTICNLRTLVNSSSILDGIAFASLRDTSSHIYSLKGSGRIYETGGHSRYVYPVDSAVLNYLKSGNPGINRWFLAEARRRKVIP